MKTREGQMEWRHRLDARAAIIAIEPQRAPSDSDVMAFRSQMPNGAAFTDQADAVIWLKNLVEQNREITTPPTLSAEMENFLETGSLSNILGDRVYGGPRVFFSERLHPPVSVRFDLWEGDPNHELKPDEVDEDGQPTIALGPYRGSDVYPYGLLGESLRLGFVLEARYGWDPVSARTWLVCPSVRPTAPAVNIDVISNEQGEPRRIRLDLDAEVPPHLVLKLLRDFQAKHEIRGGKQSRSLTPWTVAATKFAISRNDGRSWADVWREFNEAHPDYAFSTSSAFTKSVGATYQLLTGEPLAWTRPSGTR